MRYTKYDVLDERYYNWLYGGICWLDYNPATMDYSILINNDDVGNFCFTVNRQKVKNCTPELIFNRIDEVYMRALEQRSRNYYEEYTREMLGRW